MLHLYVKLLKGGIMQPLNVRPSVSDFKLQLSYVTHQDSDLNDRQKTKSIFKCDQDV